MSDMAYKKFTLIYKCVPKRIISIDKFFTTVKIKQFHGN